MLLACDGLFDVYSTEEAVDNVRAEMALDGDAQRTCEVLTERAISERFSRDNVSIVSLNEEKNFRTKTNNLMRRGGGELVALN